VRDPLVGPVAAIAAGILVARFVPFHRTELLATTAAFLLLAIFARHLLRAVCAALALLAAGALTAVLHTPAAPPYIDATGRETVILGGCVVEPPAISGERERFILQLDSRARAQVTLYTKPGEPLPALHYGQPIELDAKVRPPRNFGNPGAFDYATYLARQEIYWTASGAADTLHILPGRCGSHFEKAVMDLRQAALDRIDGLYRGDSYRTGMMQALLLGQSFQLQKVWTEHYRSTGTFHALVISGTHVAILAAFFLFLLRLCFLPESAAMFLTACAAWLYALVAGWQAPCVRSAAGLTVYLVGSYFYRRRRPLNLLAAVAIGFLVLDPAQLFDASFQLTFLAVGFLGAFATPLIQATSGPLTRGLADLANTDRDLHLPPRVAQFRIELRLLARAFRLPHAAVTVPARVFFFLYEITTVSAIIQLGLALPMVVYFHRVGISGLSANALVVPLMGVAVPVGFVAVFTGSHWAARVAGVLLGLSQRVVSWHAAIEPNWRIPTPPLWVAIAVSAALVAAALARGRWWRVATCAAVAALTLLLWHPFPPDLHPGQLELTAVDVGQGDSLLVVFPDGKRLIVDGGGIPTFAGRASAQLDTGEDVVAPYLWERGFRTVDAIALSHGHDDHIGGLPALATDFHPRELWTGATPDSPAWDKLRAAADRAGTRLRPLAAPARFPFGGAEIEVLAPLPGYIPADTPKNNDSLVLRIVYGPHSFLLTGDVERQIELWMLAENEVRRTDVLKVAHHGSRTSSTELFLDAVQPTFAVISAGFENSYGHPNREVVQRLEQRGAAVLRTDLDGLVTIRSDGHRLHVETHNGFLSGK
jgi:competence protein ComEC